MAQFQAEQDELASILSDEDMDADERVQAVKDKAKTYAAAWAALLAAAYAAIGKAAGDALYSQWKRDGLLPDEAAYEAAADDDAIQAIASGVAADIANTTHDRLDSALTGAMVAGTTAALLAALNGSYDAWTGADGDGGSRSDVIGVTGANGAWGMGQNDAASVAGDAYNITVTHTWNAILDNRTRDDHAEADGQTVPLGEPFTVGGESLMYPGDAAGSAAQTANCRCLETIDGQPNSTEE